MSKLEILASRLEKLEKLHSNCNHKTFTISDKIEEIDIKDTRLNELIWNLYVETINEMKNNLPDLEKI